MLDRLPDSEPRSDPLFSVIIPLGDHRDRWTLCLERWQAQSLDKGDFEIVLVAPQDFPQRDKLAALADASTRLHYVQNSHDIELIAIGVAKARGKYLFFTEAHCWPEPDVLEICARAFRERADCAGFSCRYQRVCPNRLSEAEADMYDADTIYGMTVHPWRRITDVCFVTRREAYDACGGLKAELGHFAEWELAANYFARGYKVDYLPAALLHHYFCGDMRGLREFTFDFVAGEIRYLARDSREPASDLIEKPLEWISRDNSDPVMARAILRMLASEVLSARGARRKLKAAASAIGRWSYPAFLEGRVAQAASALSVLQTRAALKLAERFGTRERLGARFRSHIAALIRYQRLTRIRIERRDGTRDETGSSRPPAILNRTGFFLLERYQNSEFRWSETEAAIRIRARPGRLSVLIKCLAVRSLSDQIGLRFYLDGRQVPEEAISRETDGFDIKIVVPPSGTAWLGWTCLPFPARDDPRRLGLPVMRLELA
jgi:hypothetical protein